MNNKGFIDMSEINPTFAALAMIAGVIALLVMTLGTKFGDVEIDLIWKILSPIFTFVVVYFYLVATDR